jgi:hypothetical protein
LVDLFKQADLVAVVHITGGDDGADRVIYRATVTRAFKGVTPDATIYFGPHSTYGIGADYVVFLRRTDRLERQLFLGSSNPWPAGAEAPYFEILYAGYGVLPIEYTCDFPTCEDGVLVPSSQVHLPENVATVAAARGGSSKYDTWVRRKALVELLESCAAGSIQ